MECEEARVQLTDGAAIGREAIEGVPGNTVPTGGMQAGTVEGEEFRATACCQLVYPISEGLPLMGGGTFKKLKQKAGRVTKGRAFPEDAKAVMC